MKITQTFSVETLREHGVLDGPTHPNVVFQEQVDELRWESVQRVVFTYDDLLWETQYTSPLSEMEEFVPFDGDEVECVRVEPYEVVKIDYRPVQQ